MSYYSHSTKKAPLTEMNVGVHVRWNSNCRLFTQHDTELQGTFFKAVRWQIYENDCDQRPMKSVSSLSICYQA